MNKEKNKKTSNVSINMFWSISFIVFLLCLLITPIFEFFSFNYHKLAYSIFGNSFYFPFWFNIFHEWVIIPLIFSFICLNIFFNIKGHIATIAKIITLFIITLILTLFAALVNYKDIKDVLNNNYIVKKIFVYELKKAKHRRGASRRGIMPCYSLTSYGSSRAETLFCELDIIEFRAILENKNNLRQQFILENPDENVTNKSQYEFDTYINSYRGYKFEKWQELNEINIFYLPNSGFIFKYELEKKQRSQHPTACLLSGGANAWFSAFVARITFGVGGIVKRTATRPKAAGGTLAATRRSLKQTTKIES